MGQKTSGPIDTGADEQVTLRLPSPHKHQEIFLDWEEQHPLAQVLVAPCGTKFGKALDVATPIPTPTGWTTMGKLRAGDYVFDEAGKPTKINWVTPWMEDHKCYEVRFKDGSTIVADAGHLWLTETHNERKNQARVLSANDRAKSTRSSPQVRTTEDILRSLTTRVGSNLRANHSVINVSGPLEFQAQDLPIDPYLFGVWLGDGTATTGSITINSEHQEIIDEIIKRGRIVDQVPSQPLLWRVQGLTKDLRSMGSIDTKKIPTKYLIASPRQRLDLLQGLMDTDGTISKKGHICFDNTNKEIADAVEAIAISFGIKTSRQQRHGKIAGVAHKLCYRVLFKTHLPVFKVKQKLERIKAVSKKSCHRTIVAITPVESRPVCCINVQAQSHLFLAGTSCIPTHNSLGSSLWILTQALSNQRFYCLWISPTMMKASIGYRYCKSMLPDIPIITCSDSKLEIHLGNGSFIKFIHGKDAETVIEGEAVDAFVIDETSKIQKQVWLSLFTTLTQTGGKGIITGTPRGHSWYEEVFKRAKARDPFFCSVQLTTAMSPFVRPEAIANAKRILPPHLYDQYYLAKFVTHSSVFGNIDEIWDRDLVIESTRQYWIHPDPTARAMDACTGADWAKINDWTVFTTVASDGRLIGYWRFRGGKYTDQVQRLKNYLKRFKGDMMLDYDKTGVGVAIEDIIADADIDASINGVTFTTQTKQDMITRMQVAIATGWFRSPKIERIDTEITSIEVKVSAAGHHSYAAVEGEHDDVAWSLMLAVSGAYSSGHADKVEQMMEDAVSGILRGKTQDQDDDLDAYATEAAGDDFSDDLDDLDDGAEDWDEAELDD